MLVTIHGPGIPHQIINCTAIIGLPIELLYFEAKSDEQKVNINWATATEESNDHFVIYHSMDAYHWKAIQEVKGKVNSQGTTYYFTSDEFPQKGINYYKLSSVSLSGQEEQKAITSCEIAQRPSFDTTYFTISGQPIDKQNISSGPYMVKLKAVSGTVKYEVINIIR